LPGPANWELYLTGNISLGAGTPSMPRFDGVTVMISTTATGIGSKFEIGDVDVYAEVVTTIGAGPCSRATSICKLNFNTFRVISWVVVSMTLNGLLLLR